MVACRRCIAGEFIALPFAVGCGFAGGGLREACPKEAIWQFSPFVLHRPAPPRLAAWSASSHVDWQIILLLAPVAPRAAPPGRSASRFGDAPAVLPRLAARATLDDRCSSLLATVLCVATPIKIWNNARIEHRLQEQEKLLLAAKIEALASQINPHFLFNTLTSISSLIRSQPETARMVDHQAVGAAPAAAARATITSSRCAKSWKSIDEYLDIEVIRFGPQLRVEKRSDRRHARRHRAEHDPAAARRELDQARLLAQGRRRHDHRPRSSRPNGRAIIEVEDDGMGMSRRAARDGALGRHRPQQRQRAAARHLRRRATQLQLDERAGRGHASSRSRFPS